VVVNLPSLEIFAKNVRRLLSQRNIRIKDLAEKIGLSESYLSLVLSGKKRNLGDKYKDRIAAFFNVPLSQLYSEDMYFKETWDSVPLYEDPQRLELKDLINTFIDRINLENRRTSFFLAVSMLNDRDVRSVKYYFSKVLQEFEEQDKKGCFQSANTALELPSEQRNLLALYSLAGNNAKIEWVKAIANMNEQTFNKLSSELASHGFITFVEDLDGKRVILKQSLAPSINSLFSQDKIRMVYLDLARAMQAFPDQSPFFQLKLARKMIKAGISDEAISYLSRAAASFESLNLWKEAARTWHEAAVIHGIVNNTKEKARCLCEAARCLAQAENMTDAEAMGQYAFKVLEEAGISDMQEEVCLIMGNLYAEHDYTKAAQWYKRGLYHARETSANYGRLLINLASAYFAQGKLEQAENSLGETQRWASGRSDPEVRHIMAHVDLMLGLTEFQRRNWKSSKNYFLSCVDKAPSGDYEDLAVAWHNLGMITYREDNTKLAEEYLLKAQHIYEANKLPTHWAYAGIELAKVLLREGRFDEVTSLLQKVADILAQKSTVEMGWVFLLRACIAAKFNRYKEASERAKKAIDFFQKEGAERELACAAFWLSNFLEQTGDMHASRAFRNRAYQIYDKRHWDVRELHRECSLLSPKVRTPQPPESKGKTF